MSDTDSGPDRPVLRHTRIASKIASLGAGTALAATLVVQALTGAWSVLGLLAVPGLTFLGVFLACTRILARRLRLATTILRQIRRHQFENLSAAHLPQGDEMNDLVWQVYRTGQVLEREMSDLRRMEDYRREFIGNVSHELKTPIFAIRGFAETLEGGALEDHKVNRNFVRKILRNADRLENLARDLGEIARIEQGELKMQPAPFNLRQMLSETLESLEPIAARRNVVLIPAFQLDLPPVIGDQEHIRQVVVNLVENAIKYNHEGGRVELWARLLPGGEVGISVIDNGIGIPEALLPRITERFFRVDKSRSRSQGGTGLGLAIVKHILGAHSRALQVESQEGKGSTFGFSLPAATPRTGPGSGQPAAAAAPVNSSDSSSPR
ncbi:MAG: hypothetical protein JJ896_04570 [Rhodothermales bacterium]|nr:hypothetical protein [Rhodothermales bacterium]MBO6778907.1 hypothetical protein [Rhodothermales bacterium]